MTYVGFATSELPYRSSPIEGFDDMGFRQTFDRMVAAREKQARRYVNGALLNLDDETLKMVGKTRAGIRREGVSLYPF